MMSLPGYESFHVLDEGSVHVVVRAVEVGTDRSVVIKTLRDDMATPAQGNRLRREYNITREIASPHIVSVLALKDHRNAPFIVKRDVGGLSLDHHIANGSANAHSATDASPQPSLSIIDAVRIALGLARALRDVHRAGVMHKDVKPPNVIVADDLSEVWLTDFDIASQLKRERAGESALIDLAGSLPYISPEQTGRMNRSVDTRSDLYSFGVTLYEMLVGRRPFEADDAMELVHSHIARQPQPPSTINARIPEPLSQVVMRLLAKTAENRYQSAAGVIADLEHCLQELQVKGAVDSFALGTQDVPLMLRIPEKLYGRERETRQLLDLYASVSNGSMGVVTVSGYSGIGKSSLVNELHKPITRNRGRFNVGKFDQYKRSVPYSAIVQALESFGRRMLTESDTISAAWRQRTLDALAESAGVVTDMIPTFDALLGPQAPPQEMGGIEAQNRQNRLLAQVLRASAQASEPLVIFIDDVQWADTWTLSFLDLLAHHPVPHLMLILAYRDNETPAGHPLHATLGQFEAAGHELHEIELSPLGGDDVLQLLTDTFPRTDRSLSHLSDVVLRKTDGNPFFINQFLTKLYDDGLVTVNASGQWTWEPTALERHHVTDNVVELLSQKLLTQDASQQEALASAAVIGSQFSLPVLAGVLGDARRTAEALWPAVVDGLVRIEGPQSLDDALHDPDEMDDSIEDLIGSFTHDRIRQAAFELLTDEQRIAVHAAVAQAYLETLNDNDLEDNLFDLASHLIASHAVQRTTAETARVFNILVMAGDKAMSSAAFSAARTYYESAISFHGADIWATNRRTASELYLKLATALWSNSDQQELEDLLNDLDGRGLGKHDRVRIANMRRRIAFANSRIPEAIRYAREGMELLGVTFPKKPGKLHAALALGKAQWSMRGKNPEDLAALAPSTNTDALLVIEIIAEISEAVYYNEPDLFPLILLKQLDLTLKYGNHRNSASVYTGYGIILCIALGQVDKAYAICQMSLNLQDAYNALEWRPKNELSYAYLVQQRKEHLEETFKHFRFAYRLGLETAMHSDVANATIGLSFHGFFQGRELAQLARDSETYLQTLRSIKQQRNVESQRLYRAGFLSMMDADMQLTLDRDGFNKERFIALSEESGDATSIASIGLVEAYVYVVFQEFAAARTALDFSIPYTRFLQGLISQIWIPFIDALIATRMADPANRTSMAMAFKKLKGARKAVSSWARTSPANYEHMVDLLDAERFRLRGRFAEAADRIERSVEKASRNGFVNVEALASDYAVYLYRQTGDSANEARMAEHALHSYRRWGVPGRVKQLEHGYPHLTHQRGAVSGTRAMRTTSLGTSTVSTSLDLGTAMKASHVIAAEIDKARLVHTTLSIMMENAGADRGVLLMKNNDTWTAEARHSFTDGDPWLRTEATLIPTSIIAYVDRSHDAVVLAEAPSDPQFGTDPYIAQERPLSVLCLPILHQSKLVGILYLENTLTQGAFTQERMAILNLLTVQSAISLENATLYQSLEQKVEERTRELQETNVLLEAERERAELLLRNMLPATIVERLKQGETTIADREANVSVLFADIAKFTQYAAERSPEDVVHILNKVFNTFDDLVSMYGLEKIKTIGDAYMVVAGVPEPRADHAEAIARLAADMHAAIPAIRDETGLDDLGIRIGIHSGPVVAGVIGRSKFSYDLWGDTVNVAARMESHGMVGRIHVSEQFADTLRSGSGNAWLLEERGVVDVKGRGQVRTYWVSPRAQYLSGITHPGLNPG